MIKSGRVLVLGANGLIGAHILKADPMGYQVMGATRRSNASVAINLENLEQIPEMLDRVKPNSIINCAGITSIHAAMENPILTNVVNVDAVKVIAEWSSQNSVRLIQFSTDFVYDGSKEFFYESDPANPLSIYGKSKLQSEKAALEANANSVVIRTSLVYGYVNELSRLNFPLFIISKLRKGERLDITTNQFRSPTYAGDIAHAVLKLIESDYTGILHLSGPTRRSVYEFALEVCRAFDLDPNLLTPVRTQPTTEGNCQRPLSTGLRIEKAKSIINYQSIDISSGLKHLEPYAQSI